MGKYIRVTAFMDKNKFVENIVRIEQLEDMIWKIYHKIELDDDEKEIVKSILEKD